MNYSGLACQRALATHTLQHDSSRATHFQAAGGHPGRPRSVPGISACDEAGFGAGASAAVQTLTCPISALQPHQ